MRRILAPTRPVAPFPRRPRLTLAITALAALALVACGTEKTSAGGSQSKPADTAGARSGAAFTEMLDKVAQSCPSGALGALHSGPPHGPQSNTPAEERPTGPVQTPPSDAIKPIAPTTGPEVELNARDWCASKHHEERITQALWDLADPNPTNVRKILNDLGYVDERIHDLKRSGATTRFFLDLRDRGGRLCLEGSAEGEKTVVESFAGPETGPFTPGKRNY
ncbi:hypothetical protein [Streptomyces sp. NPDC059909]|uniref:hypothetical protein n=1 Tax=Streptomyces sp. NPDC059909 TaxID=3346998 RepID=UPI0036604281